MHCGHAAIVSFPHSITSRFRPVLPTSARTSAIDVFSGQQNVCLDAMVDGKRFTFNGLMEVTGTRTYKTVIGGSKTIFVLKIVDVD
jgi:hypothetical protein